MPTLNTSDLTGAALDWAVATIVYPDDTQIKEPGAFAYVPYGFAEDWAQGGPLVDRLITAGFILIGDEPGKIACMSAFGRHDGHTPLIAAMRAFVAWKLGATVNVPKELL